MGQPDASRIDDRAGAEDEPERVTGDAAAQPAKFAMQAAVAGCLRRVYTLRYRDPYLSQLMRREPPGWREALLVGLAGLAAVTAVALALRAYRRRLWHVVTLVIRPDGRIVTHQIRAPRPPAP